jgi:hypothetical protein
MLTEEQYKILEYCYNELKWNIIPATANKRPAVKDFADYFDSKKTFTFDELVAYGEKVERPYYSNVLGKQRDGTYSIVFDVDVKDEVIKRLVLRMFRSCVYQETPRGYHFFFKVVMDDDDSNNNSDDNIKRELKELQGTIIMPNLVECYTESRHVIFLGEGYGRLQLHNNDNTVFLHIQ